MVGTTLGRYEVESLLGQGGMGEVYRARDTKLGRSVAIKVLPEAVRADPDRVARFEREAKVLAALNHPNIAALHGMEEAGGRHFLVMELVEGDTLADRLTRGPLPIEEALRIAIQIGEALEAAHEKGVVHRDLKPANIKLTPDDKVKVLDFGLAKAMESDSAVANLSQSPTLSLAATQAGIVLGTAAYMSPEQAKGLPADHRSDIFSFGAVLHEMLTGRQPFQGETAAEVMASVIVRDTDLNALPADINPRIPELLKRCLEKNPKKRWQAIGDVRAELEAISSAPRRGVAIYAVTAPPPPLLKRAIPFAITAVLAGAAAGVGVWIAMPRSPSGIVSRFSIPLGEGQQFTNVGRHLVTISPDGTRMVYVANQRLYVRSMSEMEARPIPGAENPGGTLSNPVFSPDGEWLVFYSGPTVTGGELKKIAVSGGAAVPICPANNPFGINWEQDTIFFGQGSRGIMRVSSNGGQPEVAASVGDGESAHGPQLLPDGQTLLFTIASGSGPTRWDTARIVLQSMMNASDRRPLIEAGSDGRYVPSGHIVYAVGGTLFAVPFDVRRQEVRGGPVPVVEGVRRSGAGAGTTGAAHLSFSRTGSLIYVPGPGSLSASQQDLVLVDRTGAATPLKLPSGSYQHARISPDGKYVAFSADDGKDANVLVYELSGRTAMRRLTFGGNNRFPIWTSDGQRIAFQSDREKDLAIFWQRADISGIAERLTKPDEGTSHVPESWSPDGSRLLYTVTAGENRTLWTLSLGDKRAKRIEGVESRTPIAAVFSPDGRWIAYTMSERRTGTSSAAAIYVQPFPPTGARYQIAGNGAHHPMWSPDGNELFYEPTANQLVAVTIQTRPTFSFGNPVPLPEGSFGSAPTASARNRDIAPDGKRFVTPVAAGQSQSGTPTSPDIRVVLNWFEELKARVPVK